MNKYDSVMLEVEPSTAVFSQLYFLMDTSCTKHGKCYFASCITFDSANDVSALSFNGPSAAAAAAAVTFSWTLTMPEACEDAFNFVSDLTDENGDS